jgi:hypothetical protein
MKEKPLLVTCREDPFVCGWNELEKVQPLSQQIQERIDESKCTEEKRRKNLSNFWKRGEKIRSLQKGPKEKPFVIEKVHQLYTVEGSPVPLHDVEGT